MIPAAPDAPEMSPHPYLDLAVMDELRGAIISSQAAVVLSPNLQQIWWANAEGVRLVGADSIRDALEGDAELSPVMRRQIEAAAGKLDDANNASAVMRVARGMKTNLLGFTISRITLPGGDEALLLLTEPLDRRRGRDEFRAQAAVDALTGYGSAAAVLGAEGQIISASKTFDALQVDGSELTALCEEVAGERDRLVKRTVRDGNGESPAGIARLREDPAVHLLVIASDVAETEAAPPIVAASPEPEATESTEDAPATVGSFSNRRTPTAPLSRWYFKAKPEQSAETGGNSDEAETAPEESEGDTREGTLEFEPAVNENAIPSAMPEAPSASAQPVRFVWDMDADKRFGSASEALIDTVGPENGAVSGSTWGEVAARLGFENGDEIEALIDKGDTWSGKTVSWPVDGTDLRVPVDLAGLPAYGRDRSFEGFNGFGIIRLADAVVADDTVPSGGLTPDEQETFEEIGERLSEDDGPSTASIVAGAAAGAAGAVALADATEVEETTEVVPVDELDEVSAVNEAVSELPEADDGTDSPVDVPTDELADASSELVADAELSTETRSGDEEGSTSTATLDAAEDKSAEAPLLPSAFSNRRRASFMADEENEASSTSGDVASHDTQAPDDEAVSSDADSAQELSTEGSSADDDGATTVAVGGAAAAAGAAAAGPANETDGDIESADKPSTDEPVSETGVLVPEHNVDTSILARLPIPVLVYRDDELLFANPDFTNITGYRDLHALAEVGGVERLFGGPDDRLTGDSASPIFHANGERLPVRAHIQKVPWDANPAMLLTLRPGQGRDDGPPAPEPDTGGSGQRFAVVQGGGGVSASFGDLEASELSGIVDTASDGVLILSAAGMVQAASRSAEALFDRPAQEIEGVELASLLAPESRASARDYLDGLQQTGLARLLNDGREVMLRTPRGGLVPVFMTIGQLGESNERFCAVMRDITPWKRSEEDLLRAKANAEEASQQKSHFLARISHEIRTPLNAIIGFSDMMVAERFGRIESDRYRGYLRDISRSGHHVLEIVNDLLDISKIEAGQLDLAFDTCDLNTIVSNTVAMMQADANKDRVIIRTSLSAAVPKVVADPRSLRQVILNLVSNGIKYTRAGGQVIVSTVLDEGGAVTLRVRDTGIGMSASDLDQAMQPFQRITTTPPLDRVPEGTGLGLPLTRALVEANRAQFHIESEPEEGTMVEVRFQAQRVLADR